MGKPNLGDGLKREAAAQITKRGRPVAEVSQRLAARRLFQFNSFDGLRSRIGRSFRIQSISNDRDGTLRSSSQHKYTGDLISLPTSGI